MPKTLCLGNAKACIEHFSQRLAGEDAEEVSPRRVLKMDVIQHHLQKHRKLFRLNGHLYSSDGLDEPLFETPRRNSSCAHGQGVGSANSSSSSVFAIQPPRQAKKSGGSSLVAITL